MKDIKPTDERLMDEITTETYFSSNYSQFLTEYQHKTFMFEEKLATLTTEITHTVL